MARLCVFLAAFLVAGASATLVEADGALVTPAPQFSPETLDLAAAPLQRRQTATDNLADDEAASVFCYGDNEDGICAQSYNLWDECNDLLSDSEKWNKCLCGNGAVAAAQRCDWCEEAFGAEANLNNTFSEEEATSACLMYSFTVAPVPASILSLEKAYNASYHGTLPATKGKAATGKVTSSPDKKTATGTSDSGPVSTISYYSLNGGGGDGGPAATWTETALSKPSSTSAQATGGAPGTRGWQAGEAALFSLAMLVGASMFLM